MPPVHIVYVIIDDSKVAFLTFLDQLASVCFKVLESAISEHPGPKKLMSAVINFLSLVMLEFGYWWSY